MQLFFALVGLAICNLMIIIPALIYASLLCSVYLLALSVYLSGILMSAAGLARTEHIDFHAPWSYADVNDAPYPATAVVEVTAAGVQIDGKTVADETMADGHPPPAPVSAAKSGTPVHVVLPHRFGWPEIGQGLGLVSAGILLFILGALMKRWSWRGCQTYWRWNLQQLRLTAAG